MRFALPVAVMALLSVAPASAQQFPAGPGKEILETKCGVCHGPEQALVGDGRSAAEWKDVVQEMIDQGAEVAPDEAQTLIAYLAKNWPRKAAGAPAPVTSAPGGTS